MMHEDVLRNPDKDVNRDLVGSIIVKLWFSKGYPEVELHNKISFRVNVERLLGKRLSEERYCVGYNIGESYVPCGKKIQKGCQCEECQSRDMFLLCARCNGSRCINPRAWKWCNQKFIVYLAYFGGRTVKVGVAAQVRLIERLLEQGAIAYKIYCEADNGMIARRIESRLKAKFTDRLTYKEKVNLYKNIDLDWFDRKFGIGGVLKYNLENVRLLEGKQEIKNIVYIPEILGCIGQIIITKEGYFSFNAIRGKKILDSERKDLLGYFSP